MKHTPVAATEIMDHRIAEMANWATSDKEFSTAFCSYLRALKATPTQKQAAYDVLRTQLVRLTDGAANEDTLHHYFIALADNQRGNATLLTRLAGCDMGGRA